MWTRYSIQISAYIPRFRIPAAGGLVRIGTWARRWRQSGGRTASTATTRPVTAATATATTSTTATVTTTIQRQDPTTPARRHPRPGLRTSEPLFPNSGIIQQSFQVLYMYTNIKCMSCLSQSVALFLAVVVMFLYDSTTLRRQ